MQAKTECSFLQTENVFENCVDDSQSTVYTVMIGDIVW